MPNMTSEGLMLSFRVLPEIYYCLEKEIAQINANEEIQWQERKLNKEAVINAILAEYLSKPRAERRPLLRESVKTVEIMLEARDPKGADEARLFIGKTVDRNEVARLAEKDEDAAAALPAKRK